jgi:PPM family protein phosphatase
MAEPVVHAPFLYVAAGDTWIGNRAHNEDTVLLRPDLGLYLLADGAGGENAGNVASALATTVVAHRMEETLSASGKQNEFDELGLPRGARHLASAVQRANHDILEIARSSERHMGMGTTIVAAFFESPRRVLHLAHVGDSRCYRLRDGTLELLTHDHTLVNDVLELQPDIPPERAAKLPRHVITRALGMGESVRVSIRSYGVLPGDRYLLCSDGLTDVVDEQAIADALTIAKQPEEQIRLLIDLAREASANDNVAAVVVGLDLAPGSAGITLREHPRTRPTRRSAPAVQVEEPESEDDPEIIIIGPEPYAIDDESQPEIHVVPSKSVKPEMLNAVHRFVKPKRREDDTRVDLRNDEGKPVDRG